MIEIKGIKKLEKSELVETKAGAGCWDGIGSVIVLCNSYSQLEDAMSLILQSPSLQS